MSLNIFKGIFEIEENVKKKKFYIKRLLLRKNVLLLRKKCQLTGFRGKDDFVEAFIDLWTIIIKCCLQ